MPSDTRFEHRMLINGKLVEGRGGAFVNINPATEELLGEVSDASREDMAAAIDAAREAFDSTDWSTNHVLRQRCLIQLQDALEQEREELREELIREVGCPRSLTHGPQLDAPLADALRFPASLIDTYPWESSLGDAVISVTGVNTTRQVWREAVGVVGAIVPWNFPFEVTIQKLGQALATGNTVVLKPAPDTPFNATRLGRLIAERTDIPAGVVNVVTASDHLVGEQLTVSRRAKVIRVPNTHNGHGCDSATAQFVEGSRPPAPRLPVIPMEERMTEDLTDVDFFRDGRLTKDPYPFYAALRDKGPVASEARYGVAMVTGWQEAVDVYNDDSTFSSCISVVGPFPGFPVPLDGDDITNLIAEHRDALPFNVHPSILPVPIS